MLIRITVENFKSFESPTELSAVPSKHVRAHADHKLGSGPVQLLRYASIYGANASGKTNLIDAFEFLLQTLSCGTLPRNADRFFCRNREENQKKDTSIELQFSVGGAFYVYGFSAILAQRRFTGEWLYQLFPESRAKSLFERRFEPTPEIVTELELEPGDAARFQTYAEDFANVKDSLFLTELNRNKAFRADSPLTIFRAIFRQLRDRTIVYSTDAERLELGVRYDERKRREINAALTSFDAGATKIELVPTTWDDVKREAPRLEELLDRVRKERGTADQSPTPCSFRTSSGLYGFELDAEHEEPQNLMTLRLTHGPGRSVFQFADESDGTRRLFDLMGVLFADVDDAVFIVDELDRSLHPTLARRFLELFEKRYADKNVQLIFTTHESNLMDLDLFRKDEIWLVERNADNASSLTSLERFKDVDSGSIQKNYLEGRFGAVPVLKRVDFGQEVVS